MLKDKRYQEITGIILIIFAVILLLSIVSYNIDDYSKLENNIKVKNLIGPLGAVISHGIRQAFGITSYLVIVISALSGWYILTRGKLSIIADKIYYLFYMMITVSALISLYSTGLPSFTGGYIGYYIYRFLSSVSGDLGAFIIIILLNVIGLILIGFISLLKIIVLKEKKGVPLNKIRFFIRILMNEKKLKSQEDPDQAPMNTIDEDIAKRSRTHGKGGNRPSIPWLTRFIRKSQKPLPWITKKTFIIDKDLGVKGVDEIPKLLEAFPGTPLLNSNNQEESKPFLKNTFEFNNESIIELKEDQFTHTYEDDSIEQEGPGFFDDIPDKTEEQEDDYLSTGSQEPIEEPYDYDENEEEFGSADIDVSRSVPLVFDRIKIKGRYTVPVQFLNCSETIDLESSRTEIKKNSGLLVNTLAEFGIESRVINVERGPVITLYEVQIAPGIKVNKIVSLSDDIAMALAVYRVRIVAPIPGKSAIGVEIPNKDREMVTLGDIIKINRNIRKNDGLKVALGKDILGKPVVLDLKKLPHLLIAGATGSGKSVCVNTIISSLVYNYDPNYVRFLLVDPKMVELQLYNGLPHLLTPVITEPFAAPNALKWAMYEMERRYRLLSELKTRDITRYNEIVKEQGGGNEHLPFIVLIIDELADLMMVASKEIEGYITRIAQKARAVGIHLVLATQRPSVDIITGIIKANIPARIAFQVAQKTDSRTIIDQNGAEKLLGKGDLLYQSPMGAYPVRIQGAFISEDEIQSIVKHVCQLGRPDYIDIEESLMSGDQARENDDDADELFVEALKIIEETRKASASYLQRRLSIGYNRAARIIELMEDRGYVGPQQGSKPRDVFI